MLRPTLAATLTIIALAGAGIAQEPPALNGFDAAAVHRQLEALRCHTGASASVRIENDLLALDDVPCKSGRYDIRLTATLDLFSMVQTAANAEFATSLAAGEPERQRINLALDRFNCFLGDTLFYVENGHYVTPDILCNAGTYDARLDAEFNVLSLTIALPGQPLATVPIHVAPPTLPAVPWDNAQPVPAPAQTAADSVGVDVRAAVDLDLRFRPELTEAVLTVVPAGSIVVVNSCLEGFAWCDVTAGNARGWTDGLYLISVTMEQPVTVVGERLGIPTTALLDEVPIPLVTQVCFYVAPNFTGTAFCAPPGQITPTLPAGWDRGFSSIRVPVGVPVEVCTQPDFGGDCRVFNGDVPQLPPIFDAGVLSYRPPQPAAAPPASGPAPNQVCFFAGPNFGGEQLCVRADLPLARMSPEWNDRISSLRVGTNAAVEVCTDEGFAGTCRSFEVDVAQLPATLNNTISSYGRGQSSGGLGGGPAPNQVCFYGDFNFAGAVLCTTVTQAVPVTMTEVKDSISSIRVGAGTSIQVCTETNFRGVCEIFDADVPRLPEALNDAIRSYRRP